MRLAYMQDNGTAAVVYAADKVSIEAVLGELTDEQYRAHVIERSIPKGKTFLELPNDWTPPDRDFRGAWTVQGKAVDIDMEAARNIWRDRMRAARVSKLQALDVEFQRATEDGADTSAIIARKRALRDVTANPAIDAAATAAELKAVWPEELA